MPKVSVVIPAYNVEGCLDRCMNSVVRQSFEDVELLLVDDGSTDGTSAMCDAWGRRDERVRVIHKSNGGLSSARNAALSLATGTYVMFVDSDDWLTEHAVELAVGKAEATGADLVCFDFLPSDGLKDLPRALAAPQPFPSIGESDGAGCLAQLYAGHIGNFVWSFLYRRALFDDPGNLFPEDVRFLEDVWFTNNILRAVSKVSYLNAALYRYYQAAGGTLTTARSPERAEAAYELLTSLEQAGPVTKELYPDYINYLIDLYFFIDQIGDKGNDPASRIIVNKIRRHISGLVNELGFSHLRAENMAKAALLRLRLYDLVMRIKR